MANGKLLVRYSIEEITPREVNQGVHTFLLHDELTSRSLDY